MKTKEQWLSNFTNPCYKENTYEFHPYGIMVVPNREEVICFYPIITSDGHVSSFVVNTFKIQYLDENTWYRDCANHNSAKNCTSHCLYGIDEAYEIYTKYADSK